MTSDDNPLAKQVDSAISKNPYVDRRHLRFEARDGHVVLRGIVPSYYQKQMAQEALRSIEGIQQIENELEVCWS